MVRCTPGVPCPGTPHTHPRVRTSACSASPRSWPNRPSRHGRAGHDRPDSAFGSVGPLIRYDSSRLRLDYVLTKPRQSTKGNPLVLTVDQNLIDESRRSRDESISSRSTVYMRSGEAEAGEAEAVPDLGLTSGSASVSLRLGPRLGYSLDSVLI